TLTGQKPRMRAGDAQLGGQQDVSLGHAGRGRGRLGRLSHRRLARSCPSKTSSSLDGSRRAGRHCRPGSVLDRRGRGGGGRAAGVGGGFPPRVVGGGAGRRGGGGGGGRARHGGRAGGGGG